MVFVFLAALICPNCGAVLHGYDLSTDATVLAVIKCRNCGEEYEMTYDKITQKSELRKKRVH